MPVSQDHATIVRSLQAMVEQLPECGTKASMRGLVAAATRRPLDREALEELVDRLDRIVEQWAAHDPLLALRNELKRLSVERG